MNKQLILYSLSVSSMLRRKIFFESAAFMEYSVVNFWLNCNLKTYLVYDIVYSVLIIVIKIAILHVFYDPILQNRF